MIIFLVVSFIILMIVWAIESRLFLVLFHKIIFWKIKSPAIYDRPEAVFKGHLDLKENWEIVKLEALQVLGKVGDIPRFHEIDKANRKISSNDGPAWKTFIIKAFGGWWENNSNQMPQTTSILRKYPEVSCAMLSILEPGVNIPPHTGKFKGILRYHLGLIVPHGQECFMRVKDQKIYWTPGSGVLFDDTYIHEVQNNTKEYRIILFLNLERKMPKVFSRINRWILNSITWSPVYFKGRKKGDTILI